MDYIFISDFFVDQVLGGGELNDDELVKLIKQKNTMKDWLLLMARYRT